MPDGVVRIRLSDSGVHPEIVDKEEGATGPATSDSGFVSFTTLKDSFCTHAAAAADIDLKPCSFAVVNIDVEIRQSINDPSPVLVAATSFEPVGGSIISFGFGFFPFPISFSQLYVFNSAYLV
jgi:hypothetical protein